MIQQAVFERHKKRPVLHRPFFMNCLSGVEQQESKHYKNHQVHIALNG